MCSAVGSNKGVMVGRLLREVTVAAHISTVTLDSVYASHCVISM